METDRLCRPAKPFLGVRFVLFGFDSIDEPKTRFKLIDGGGVEAGHYSPNCTHVIVDNIVYDDPLCIAARKDCKTLVTGLWVDHSYDNGKAVDFTSIMYRPPKDLNGIPGAKSLVICLTGYQRLDRDDIMTLVGLMGAQFSKPLVATKVTHLICYKFEGEKYDLGKRLPHIKLVNHRWLEDCLREWEILPEADYNKSSYELEMMEAEAKDSEDEAEGTSPKQPAEVNIQKSSYNLKPGFSGVRNSPKLGAETPKAKYPANVSNTNLQGINHRSEQTSSLVNISSSKASNENVCGLKATTKELPQHHYQSPFRKNATKDLTPSSRSVERPPHSDGKFAGVSYSRKTQRSLGELSSNHGFDKETLSKPKDDLFSSFFLSPDQPKDAGGSNYFESPKEGNELLSAERPIANSAQKSTWTGSYGTPYLQKMGSDKPCFRKSPSPSDEIAAVEATFVDDLRETRVGRDSISLIEGANNAKSTIDDHPVDIINQSSRFTKLSTPEPLKSESRQHVNGNVKTSPTSAKRLKMSPVSKVPGSSNSDFGNSPSMDANTGVPRDHVKGSGASHKNPENDVPSSLNLEGNDNPVSKKMAAKKSLGSRPKIASKANLKGSIYLDGKTSSRSDSAVVINGPAKEAETLDDETETPEERVEPILKNLTNKENDAAIELARETAIWKEKETVVQNLSNDAETSTRGLAANQEKAEDVSENADGKNISARAQLKSKGDGSKRKKARQKAPEAIESKNNVDSRVIHNETNEVKEMEKEKKPITGPTKSKNQKASKRKSGKPDEGEKENKPIESGAENKSQPKSDTKKKAKPIDSEAENKSQPKSDTKKKAKPVNSEAENKSQPERETKKKAKPVDSEAEDKSKPKRETKKKAKPVDSEAENKSQPKSDTKKKFKPVDSEAENESQPEKETKKKAIKSDAEPSNVERSSAKRSSPSSSGKAGSVTNRVEAEPVLFILSGHRFQRKEFQKIIRRLKGKFCRDSHQWSYQATHFIAPDPIRRTEKFFAAAASGRWILKQDYLRASNEAGKLLPEEAYEWHKNGLSEDGAINLEAPRKWRLLRERTGHGAFHGMRIIIYGECIAPPLDTLKRAVKAGDGTILATSPPYTRLMESGVDFAIVSPGMARVDFWVQELLRHEIPCVAADYLVEYVCKSGYSLEKHVLYNTHGWAESSLARLRERAEELAVDHDTPCNVCGSADRAEVMLICGDESGSSGCGIGCHIDCCDPPLEDVPEDDWFCSDCANKRSDKKRKLNK